MSLERIALLPWLSPSAVVFPINEGEDLSSRKLCMLLFDKLEELLDVHSITILIHAFVELFELHVSNIIL
eukprot:Skav216297  [mRNA]  locus=scaffold494:113458:115057:+ [translate_table: standard]